MRAVRLNLDSTYQVFDLGPYPHLNQEITPEAAEAPFGLTFLNGPTHLHPDHITVGLAFSQTGLQRRLPVNNLACSLQGVFNPRGADAMFGMTVVIGSDWHSEIADVPYWTIDLVREIKRSCDIAFRYHQCIEGN